MCNYKKKILIITYYYPPAGGPGVQRWLFFSKYLLQFKIDAMILKPKNPSYPVIDKLLLNKIPKNQKIIEIPILEPYFLAKKINIKNRDYQLGQFNLKKDQNFFSKLSLFIRGNFFIPDARKFWINPCYKFLKNFFFENSINTIITTGPPHSVHLIGLKLKKFNNNINWIADFRDPWTQISYHNQFKMLNFVKKKHKKLESEVVKNADVILTTSYSDVKYFLKLGVKKCVTITNGFDSNLFKKKIKTKKFTLTYCGTLDQQRNPKVLWESIAELVYEKIFNVDNFELKFVGKIDESIIKEIEYLKLQKSLNLKGYLSYNESLKESQNSDVLLITNFYSEEYQGIIPGKLFDYLSTQNTILSFGPSFSDVEKIIKQTKSGFHFNYKEKLNVKFFLFNCFNRWINNQSVSINKKEVMKFHRKNLTRYLLNFL